MSKPVVVKLRGEDINAVDLDFEIKKEDWNIYETEDGATIKIKLVVSSIARTEKFDAEGNPVYVVKSTNLLNVSIPDRLKKGSEVH